MKTKFILAEFRSVEEWGGREAGWVSGDQLRMDTVKGTRFPQATGAKAWLILMVQSLEVEQLA